MLYQIGQILDEVVSCNNFKYFREQLKLVVAFLSLVKKEGSFKTDKLIICLLSSYGYCVPAHLLNMVTIKTVNKISMSFFSPILEHIKECVVYLSVVRFFQNIFFYEFDQPFS